MNLPYADLYPAFWNATPAELQYSPLMQAIPTTISPIIPFDQPTNSVPMHPPPLYRPYNYFSNLSVPPSTNLNGIGIQDDGPHKSAFKPVTRQPVNLDGTSTEKMKLYAGEPFYFSTQNVTMTPLISTDTFNYGVSHMPLPYEPHLYRDFGGINSMGANKGNQNADVTTKNIEISCDVSTQQLDQSSEIVVVNNSPKPVAECDETETAHIEKSNNDIINPIEGVYHWDTLLPLVPDPKEKRTAVTMPQRKLYARKRRRDGSNIPQYADVNVPIIDLTSSEDFDECIPSSVIESNKTPPLDINGNEILITTNTKTMQAITYKKAKDVSITAIAAQKQEEKLVGKNAKNSTNAAQQAKGPILAATLKQNNRVPPREQLKFITKYGRYMVYFRKYNGFRLFVQRNYTRAQTHAPRTCAVANITYVHNTLLKWWNAMSSAGKEQYAQMADTLHARKANETQTNANNGTQSISIIPIYGDKDTSKAANVSVNRNSDAGVTAIVNNDTNTGITAHSQSMVKQ